MSIESEFKFTSLLILPIIIVILLNTNLIYSEVLAQEESYATYSNFGFIVKYPSSWTVSENMGETFEEVYIRSSAEDMTAPGIIIS